MFKGNYKWVQLEFKASAWFTIPPLKILGVKPWDVP
jgi:hypothetical protein